ncbi:unnamed protein product [Boreogadus saida]
MLNMGAVLLLLTGVADGVKTFCDATQPNITTQCSGSLGGTVEVQLPTRTSQGAGKQVAYTKCYLTIQALVPIIAGSLSVTALLLIVALGVYCAKKHKTSKDTTEAEDVTYADVSVLQRRGQRRDQGEGEVEYGAVRVAPGPGRTLETNVDECLYAQPRRKRP